jgi:hypothetical protein
MTARSPICRRGAIVTADAIHACKALIEAGRLVMPARGRFQHKARGVYRAPHGAIIVTNQDSIYGRLTDDIVDNVDNVKTAHLRSDAPTTSRRDNVNIVNNVRVSKTSLSPLTSAFSAIEQSML